jgi:2-C-methyl-D-erythritol 4-phosphate cytidylyltransferase/2-C-methyl-D-erythritol 2,4-cyclodiphosphate synthase
MTDRQQHCIVCVAAGRGARFGADKLAENLGRSSVLETALTALEKALPGVPLVVVVSAERLPEWGRRLHMSFPAARLVTGGPRRQDSVRRGVETARELGADIVVVHDAARPLVAAEDVRGVVWALGDSDGAVLSNVVTDSVKRIDESGLILETVDRDRLRLAQTPQVFRVDALLEAWGRTDPELEYSDESALLEWAGMTVRSVVASHSNPKLTRPSDLVLMRGLIEGTS